MTDRYVGKRCEYMYMVLKKLLKDLINHWELYIFQNWIVMKRGYKNYWNLLISMSVIIFMVQAL